MDHMFDQIEIDLIVSNNQHLVKLRGSRRSIPRCNNPVIIPSHSVVITYNKILYACDIISCPNNNVIRR